MSNGSAVRYALLAGSLLLLGLIGCNPFAPPPATPTPDSLGELRVRADQRFQSGLQKLNQGDFRGALTDLEEARVYMTADDPRLREISSGIERARAALTPTPGLTLQPTPSGPPAPSTARADAAQARRLFGDVYVAAVPTPGTVADQPSLGTPVTVRATPAPATTFQEGNQAGLYVQRIDPSAQYRLRVFLERQAGRVDFLGEVGNVPGTTPPTQLDGLLWYTEAPLSPGTYIVELYSGPTLVYQQRFTVREQIVLAATATPVPPATAAPPPPPPPPPPAPPTAPPTPAPPTATPTPRPPGPVTIGQGGVWREVMSVKDRATAGEVVWGIAPLADFRYVNEQFEGRILAATRNGLWRSENGGREWRRARLGSGNLVTSVAVSPVVPDLVLAVVRVSPTTAGVYRSNDGGISFAADPLLRAPVSEVVFSPNGDAVFALGYTPESGRKGTLYRSPDNGASWTPVLNLGNQDVVFAAVAFSPTYATDRTIFVGSANVPDPVPTPRPSNCVVVGGQPVCQPEPTSTPLPYAARQGGSYGTVFRSNDGGATWQVGEQPRTRGESALASVWSLAVAPARNGYALYAGTDDGLGLWQTASERWVRVGGTTRPGEEAWFLLDLVAAGDNSVMGVRCPEDAAQLESGGLGWKQCQTSIWNGQRWTSVDYEQGTGREGLIGTLDLFPMPGGPPAILLGKEGGQILLYSQSRYPQ